MVNATHEHTVRLIKHSGDTLAMKVNSHYQIANLQKNFYICGSFFQTNFPVSLVIGTSNKMPRKSRKIRRKPFTSFAYVAGDHSSTRGTGGPRNERHTCRWHHDSATEKER